VLGFLHDLSDALAAFIAQLEQYAAVPKVGDRHPLLALDHGLAVYRASFEWAGGAMAALATAPNASS
jgi:hypothetical protein